MPLFIAPCESAEDSPKLRPAICRRWLPPWPPQGTFAWTAAFLIWPASRPAADNRRRRNTECGQRRDIENRRGEQFSRQLPDALAGSFEHGGIFGKQSDR